MTTESAAPLVQAIAVTPGTHFETVAAVATASAIAAAQPRPADQPAWDTWFAGAFTKTVRRASKPRQIEKLDDDPLAQVDYRVGDAVAYAYAPMEYDAFPKHLRQLQVSGLDIDRSRDDNPRYWQSDHPTFGAGLVPLVMISEKAGMSTGKTAAQVAHALVAWGRALAPAVLRNWAEHPALRLAIGELDDIPAAGNITIRDNGLTEVVPGTPTVRIARP